MVRQTAISAFLLAEDESCLALDRKVLRRLGVVQTQFFASGRKALDHMHAAASAAASCAANGPATAFGVADMLICNERLADMTGMRFLSHVRSMPVMADIPALFLVGNGESATALAARATNSCAVLSRPYTLDQAEAALAFASRPEARHVPLVLPPSFIDRFGPRAMQNGTRPEETKFLLRRPISQSPSPEISRPEISRPEISRKALQPPGEIALREGLAALGRGDAVTADKLLYGSYQVDPHNAEVCLALSKLSAFLHKEKEEFMWLCKAGVLCLKRGDKVRAAALLGRLPRGKAGQEPLLAEAGSALQEGEATAAALTFLEAHRLDPSKPLHALIGRTCMFTPAPEEHMRGLIQALSRVGHDATASKLHQRLLQPPKEDEERQYGFFDNFPLLHDIVSIASYTFKTWRTAA